MRTLEGWTVLRLTIHVPPHAVPHKDTVVPLTAEAAMAAGVLGTDFLATAAEEELHQKFYTLERAVGDR